MKLKFASNYVIPFYNNTLFCIYTNKHTYAEKQDIPTKCIRLWDNGEKNNRTEAEMRQKSHRKTKLCRPEFPRKSGSTKVPILQVCVAAYPGNNNNNINMLKAYVF